MKLYFILISNSCQTEIFAERFDEDPFLLFRLRGKSQDALLEALSTHTGNGLLRESGAEYDVPEYETPPLLPPASADFWAISEKGVHFPVEIAPPSAPYPALIWLGAPAFMDNIEVRLGPAHDAMQVHLVRPLSPSERLRLEVIATPIDEQTYQLDEVKLLTAVENGQQLDPLIDLLGRSHQGECFSVIFDWLMGVSKNVNAFKEVDTAVLIRLNQADLLAMVREDKALAKICQPVGEREIMVRKSHMARFRKRLKTLGYLLT